MQNLERIHSMALSEGQKQRLAVVSGFLGNKEIMIFDEPTSGLDFKRMQNVVNIIKNLSSKQKIIIVITHDIELIHSLQVLMIEL